MKRVTLKQINSQISKHGYELIKGGLGYFYFWPLDDAHTQLYDDAIRTSHLSNLSIEGWEQELLYKIEHT